MEHMTPRERILCAIRGLPTDRIAVAPDLYAMIPCRLTGKPYWDIYFNESPPLWQAFVDAANHFDIDALSYHGTLRFVGTSRLSSHQAIERHEDHWIQHVRIKTPDGDLTQTLFCPREDVASYPEHLVKDFVRDFKKLRHLFSDVSSHDREYYEAQRRYMGDRGLTGMFLMPPGFQIFHFYFQGSLEAVTYAREDEPDLFEELVHLYARRSLQELEIALDCRVDCIITGGSGSITLQSPEIWRELSLPTIRTIADRCRQAGIPCGIHSCGLERFLVEMCAAETAIDFVNPLEIPPMGDCDMQDLLDRFGDRLTLMGNLHTIDVMLNGTEEDVRARSEDLLRMARGKRFVLSTGDQCPRDTPDANIRAMVEAARRSALSSMPSTGRPPSPGFGQERKNMSI